MDLDRNGLEVLSEQDCWLLLEATHLGRLAMNAGSRVEVFPLNYVVDRTGGDPTILLLTSPGTKLTAGVAELPVAFEIDSADPLFHTGWSVVVHGRAELVESLEVSGRRILAPRSS